VVHVRARAGGAATARPDLSGYWELRFDSFNVPRAPLTTAAQGALEMRRAKDQEAIRGCVNVGMPAVMDDRGVLDIRQSPAVIGMVARSPSSTRYIYTDGRKHPDAEELEGTTNGHSIGRWQGDTLVVDTVGFNERGITAIPGGRLPDIPRAFDRVVQVGGLRRSTHGHVHLDGSDSLPNAPLLHVPVLQGGGDAGAARPQLHSERRRSRTISDRASRAGPLLV
jgi:hypothetical protein